MKRITNILITGQPGVGKTTVIRKLAEELRDLDPAGFYTAEIREEGTRKGFELISLDGRKSILAHVNIDSPYRVSKYGVDIEGFETLLSSLSLRDASRSLFIIDEIGKMECFSGKFRTIIRDILDSDKLLVATIALKGSGIIQEIKRRDDVKSFLITLENRDSLLPIMVKEINDIWRTLSRETSPPNS